MLFWILFICRNKNELKNVIDRTNIQYKIALNTDTFKELVETPENELFKNSKVETKLRSRKIRGTWVKPFQKLVNEYEKQEFKMLGMCLIFVSKSLFNLIYSINFLGKAAMMKEKWRCFLFSSISAMQWKKVWIWIHFQCVKKTKYWRSWFRCNISSQFLYLKSVIEYNYRLKSTKLIHILLIIILILIF